MPTTSKATARELAEELIRRMKTNDARGIPLDKLSELIQRATAEKDNRHAPA